ncbi:hypothetical protein H0H87_007579 [Tephrocybe sp. NHM501043]|nr:hypothetical protein H0H87_007579 [Tephrocybe sp. NHM501043]
MSSITFIEQRPPFIFQLVSRVSAYSHTLISVLAMLLFMAFPSLAIAKPPVRAISRKPRRKILTSTTSSLVDAHKAAASRPTLKEINETGEPILPTTSYQHSDTVYAGNEKKRHVSFSQTCHKISSSLKTALPRHEVMKPIVLRLSIPVRRLSSQFIVALHHCHLVPHHHDHLSDNADSYFTPIKSTTVEAAAGNKAVEQEAATGKEADTLSMPPIAPVFLEKAMVDDEVVEVAKELSPCQNTHAPRRKSISKAFKGAARRASVVLGFAHRS